MSVRINNAKETYPLLVPGTYWKVEEESFDYLVQVLSIREDQIAGGGYYRTRESREGFQYGGDSGFVVYINYPLSKQIWNQITQDQFEVLVKLYGQ